MNKSEHLGVFNSLPLKQRNAIIAMVESDKSLEEIRNDVHVGRTAFYNWRNKDSNFIKAQQEYSQHALNSATSKATRKLISLLNSKNDYLAYNAALSILNLGGIGSINDNSDLDKAKIRKANAEADIAETRAKTMKDPNNSNSKLNEIMSIIVDEVKETDKDGNK